MLLLHWRLESLTRLVDVEVYLRCFVRVFVGHGYKGEFLIVFCYDGVLNAF
ncbi:MAG: hypothetical protein WKF34_13775 [Pyrinomonadaceae bacterium]